ncbi:MAG: YdcF family protein [Oscillospiraceae bacterium]|nr:YdcF family protein [Oscillospiraceae bacterium]
MPSWLSGFEELWVFLTIFAVLLCLFILLCYGCPYRLGNSILLLFTLLFGMMIAAALIAEDDAYFVLYAVLAVLVMIALVPIMLIWNGVLMIKREAFGLANILSLLTGLLILGGEAAVVVFVLRGAPSSGNGLTGGILLLFGATVFYAAALLLSFVLYVLVLPLLPHRKRFSAIIIHGCALIRGETVSRILGARVEKALEIYRKSGVSARLIASGGQGDDETISEAEAMERFMLGKGVPHEAIVREDKSRSSRENLVFAERRIEELGIEGRTALVTSNYHLFRCLMLAHELGIRCTGFGAKVAAYYWPSAVIREFAAVYLQKKVFLRALIGYAVTVLLPFAVLMFGFSG